MTGSFCPQCEVRSQQGLHKGPPLAALHPKHAGHSLSRGEGSRGPGQPFINGLAHSELWLAGLVAQLGSPVAH